MFNDIYQNRRVFLTGDTGFKGSWLRLWLESMGADVYGYSLAPNTQPNHFELLGYKRDKFNDILDVDSLQKAFAD
ncbi:MAG: CDP-glucose 4,6-dehydratase, partial [Thermoguttaceae bacterium]|nr:CDP-glucose 4,6-dehydratase [Thermoguttaceae bacterium]